MRAFVGTLIVAACAIGCGKTTVASQPGDACTDSGDCSSGTCVDGVCCTTACDGACMACSAAKTGAADGTCAPVAASTDPDSECTATDPSTCGVSGHGCNGDAAAPACNLYQATAPCGTTCTQTSGEFHLTYEQCNGSGQCLPATAGDSCGYYACGAGNTACATTCAANNECSVGGYCKPDHTCAKQLHVALEASADSCVRTGAFARLQAALTARGHLPAIVSADMIATDAQLAAYDVVVLQGDGGFCTQPDYRVADAALGDFVRSGGGLVGTGWLLYNGPSLNVSDMMPASGSTYMTGPVGVMPIGASPIVAGLHAFTDFSTYLPYGGASKPGATALIQNAAGTVVGSSWPYAQGRVVYFGLLYFDDYEGYSDQGLLDGSTPDSVEMMLRAIEWSAKSL